MAKLTADGKVDAWAMVKSWQLKDKVWLLDRLTADVNQEMAKSALRKRTPKPVKETP